MNYVYTPLWDCKYPHTGGMSALAVSEVNEGQSKLKSSTTINRQIFL